MAYATNNASRRSSEVADLLTGMGVPARPEEVLTSAAAAAELLRDRLPAGAPVLVVGAEALRAELRAVGLNPVTQADEKPAAVVQGYGPQVGWAELAEASVAVRAGAIWIATNTDRTLPSRAGPAARQRVAGRRAAYGAGAGPRRGGRQAGAGAVRDRRPAQRRRADAWWSGDRLDTDIEGARRAGLDSLLVLTGVSDAPRAAGRAEPQRRPTYVASGPGRAVRPGRRRAGPGPGGRWRLVGDGDRDGRWSWPGPAGRWTPWPRSARWPGRRRVPALPKIRAGGRRTRPRAVETFRPDRGGADAGAAVRAACAA